jgi:glycosyltransferase involved in cell wall biosynthesis
VKRYHILTVAGSMRFGGDSTRLLNFARTLDRSRFEHTIVTIIRPEADRDQSHAMREHYAAAGIELEDLGEGRYPIDLDAESGAGATRSRNGRRRAAYQSGQVIGAAGMFARLVAKVARLIRERKVDVLDARGEVAGVVAVTAGRLTRTPAVVTTYGMRAWKPLFMRLPGQFTWGFAHAVLTDSHDRAKKFKEWTWRRNSRVVVIPNGIDRPKPQQIAPEVRAALGLPSDGDLRVVGQIGRIAAFKGLRILLEAARSVLAELPDAMFLVVGYERPPGDTAFRRELEQRAVEYGIGDRVIIAHYPGPIGDVWSVIDLHVHSSLYDSLPIAVQEGMSLGKPAVVTSVGGIPDMVENERTGLVVPPGDSEALGAAILRLLRDQPTAERLGRAAAQRYEERYRPEVMTRAIEDLFLELIGV